jgi:hypothetical protein
MENINKNIFLTNIIIALGSKAQEKVIRKIIAKISSFNKYDNITILFH